MSSLLVNTVEHKEPDIYRSSWETRNKLNKREYWIYIHQVTRHVT